MRKLKLVFAFVLAILLMVSCVGLSALAEPDETSTQNREKTETSNTDAPGEAPAKTEQPKQEPPEKEEPKTKAPEEKPNQEAPKDTETAKEPKQESTNAQELGSAATEPEESEPKSPKVEDAGNQHDVQSNSDSDLESGNADQTENEPKPQDKVFEVIFVVEGDKTVVKLAEGEIIAKPNNDPVKTGYDFVHWYDADGSNQTEFGFGGGAKKDLELRALFKKTESDAESQDDANADDPQLEPTTADEEASSQSGMESATTESDEAKTDRSITIVSDRGNTVQYGDTITLTGKLGGFADERYSLTWRHDNGSGAWTDYSQGSAECTFVIDEKSIHWNWQLVAVIDE